MLRPAGHQGILQLRRDRARPLGGRLELPTPAPAPLDGTVDIAGTRRGRSRWTFAATVPIPCYGAAVVAGPYAFHEGVLHGTAGDIPARVYGRPSLEQHFDGDRVLADTQAGLELYERVFRTPTRTTSTTRSTCRSTTWERWRTSAA
ncbi:hypothetical protein [Demequina sediminis]|uniref:hypothetical protein n=1 Tax=Demequina sediminis TaxID=1930058 RepID=UPI0025733303|nr:hypothetical protein [Demequina sediminis]